MQLFGVSFAKDNFITECEFDDTKSKHLRFVCGEEESKNMLDNFTTNANVQCGTKSVVIKTIETVEFDRCSFELLPKMLLSQFSGLKLLHIFHVGLTDFREQDLPSKSTGRSNLQTLILIGNNIETFNPAVIQSLPSLKTLAVVSGRVRKVHPFPDAPKLRSVILSGNFLINIPKDTFTKLPGLRFLYLAQNLLRSAAVHLSDNNELRVLDLSYNQMADLKATDLANLKQLKRLNLNKMSLRNIETDSFSQLRNLVKLDLSDNKIKAIPGNSFEKLIQLNELRLSKNKLEKLELNFNEGNNLQLLDVSNNHIVDIDNELLRLKKLSKLDLSGNTIGSFGKDTFKRLNNLKELRLANNKLASAALHFDTENSLNLLDLSYNKITELHIGDVAALKHLKTFSISFGKLKTIELGTFSALFNLITLDLSRNQLAEIDFRDFLPSMPFLTTLNLHANQLTELDDNLEHLFPKLNELLISGNQFNCSYLKKFLETLGSRSTIADKYDRDLVYGRSIDIGGISCKNDQRQSPPTPPSEASKPSEEEKKTIGHGFSNGFNVWVFVLVLWIGVTNSVICGGIVVFVRKTATV